MKNCNASFWIWQLVVANVCMWTNWIVGNRSMLHNKTFLRHSRRIIRWWTRWHHKFKSPRLYGGQGRKFFPKKCNGIVTVGGGRSIMKSKSDRTVIYGRPLILKLNCWKLRNHMSSKSFSYFILMLQNFYLICTVFLQRVNGETHWFENFGFVDKRGSRYYWFWVVVVTLVQLKKQGTTED